MRDDKDKVRGEAHLVDHPPLGNVVSVAMRYLFDFPGFLLAYTDLPITEEWKQREARERVMRECGFGKISSCARKGRVARETRDEKESVRGTALAAQGKTDLIIACLSRTELVPLC